MGPVLCLLVLGCTEPKVVYFDGGVPDPGRCVGDAALVERDCIGGEDDGDDDDDEVIIGDDAAVGLTPDPSDWAKSLAGVFVPGTSSSSRSYAMRARFYGKMQNTRVAGQMIALASIRRDRTTVSMTTRACQVYREHTPPQGNKYVVTMLRPSFYLPRPYTLTDRGGWKSDKPETQNGYTPAVAGCENNPGNMVRFQERVQPWLSGTEQCQCPSPTSPDVPTAPPIDCRLVDLDEEKEPGLTLQVTVGGQLVGSQGVAIRDRSEFLLGTFPTHGRFTALYAFDQVVNVVHCTGQFCNQTSLDACGPNFNPVIFAPVQAETCDELMRVVSSTPTLFEDERTELTFPPGCEMSAPSR